jgi:chemotaxis protein methyltransferase CheR
MPHAPSGALILKYRDLIYDRYGIHFEKNKVDILEMKLRKMADSGNLSLDAFYDRLVVGDADAVDELIHAITVGHTFFFREEPHMALLAADIRKRNLSRPLIWCAACSSGEEAYSIAISLLEQGLDDFVIVCSDVNANALMAMNEGLYHANKLQYTGKYLVHKYFRKASPYTWRIKPDLRSYLRIKRLNLQTDILFERQFDFIFCRNVMIYFDETGRQRVMRTLSRNLAPSGLVFVGHAEAMLMVPRELRKEGPAVFRRVS